MYLSRTNPINAGIKKFSNKTIEKNLFYKERNNYNKHSVGSIKNKVEEIFHCFQDASSLVFLLFFCLSLLLPELFVHDNTDQALFPSPQLPLPCDY